MHSQQSSNSRCLRTFNDGRQCRMLRKPGHAALCVFHAREEEQILESEKLAAELSSLSGNLNTGLDINHVLGKVFQALAHRRISAREATAFAYIVQLSLQSMPFVKSDIRWATNDAGAYHRMVRQTVPTIRDLPQRPPASPPPATVSRVAHPSHGPDAEDASGLAQPKPGLEAKGGSSDAFTQVLSSTQSPAQAFLAARRASSASGRSSTQSSLREPRDLVVAGLQSGQQAPPASLASAPNSGLSCLPSSTSPLTQPPSKAQPQTSPGSHTTSSATPQLEPRPPQTLPQPQPSVSTGHVKSPAWEI